MFGNHLWEEVPDDSLFPNGHGLGLFIVCRAVVKLGGQIRVEISEAGTTFHLDIPSRA